MEEEPKIFQMSDQDLKQLLESHLSIKTLEKDHFGEVMTPLSLIDEMLDALPSDVWLNPDLKWLDPAAGIGNFPIMIYQRLFHSLKNKIPNDQERKKHIVKNMLYMVEINPQNVKEARRIFGPDAHISLADFLNDPDKWRADFANSFTKDPELSRSPTLTFGSWLAPTGGDAFGGGGFDIILGNPPFQKTKNATYDGGAGKRTLWDKFMMAAIEGSLLKEGGYLAFLTPAGWRRPKNSLYDLATRQNKLLYLHVYGKSDGKRLFGVGTRFDIYVIVKGTQGTQSNPTIIDELGQTHKNINVVEWPFLPNYNFDNIRKILVDPKKKKGINVIFSSSDNDARKLSKEKTDAFQYPIVHGITQKGLGLRYASRKNEDQFGVPKVLLNFNERQYPYNDFAGEYGMSQLTFGIPIQTQLEGEQWIRTINSSFFQEIIRATKWGTFQTDYRMFRYFDSELYKK